MIKFAHIDYSMTTESLDIFIIGCKGSCKGCCNPEIKDFNLSGLNMIEVLQKTKELNDRFNKLIKRVILVGGDFIDNYKIYSGEVISFLENLKKIINKPIFLFTRFKLEEIPKEILELVDFVKCGAYIPELKADNNTQYGIKLATSNQKIYKKGLDY